MRASAQILQVPAHIFVRGEKPRGNTVFRARRKYFPHTRSRAPAHALARLPRWVRFCGLCEREMWNPEWIERARDHLRARDVFLLQDLFLVEARRDLPDDCIQPRVIDVISLPRVTVAPSACALNAYPGLPALPEMLGARDRYRAGFSSSVHLHKRNPGFMQPKSNALINAFG